MCSRVAVALSVDVLPRLDHFGSQVSEQFHVGLLLVLVMASRPSIVLNYVLKRFDLSETICRFTDLQVKAENLWHLLTVEAPLAFLRALLQQTPWRESLAVGSQQSQWKTILLVLQRVFCIVLVFTKFHFFFSLSPFVLFGAFVLWILSLPTEFLFKLCPGQVHQPPWLQWWPLWLEQRCPSSCGLLTTKVMLKKCIATWMPSVKNC